MEKRKITETVIDLMDISAQTSLKSSGNYLETMVLDDAEKEMLAEELYQLSEEFQDETYSEEGDLINSSDELLIIGLEDHPSLGIDCKACGYESCEDFSEADQTEQIFEGPNCVFRLLDLGISIGNALNTAETHNIDYQISIKGGLAAKNLGLMDSRVCLAVPIHVISDKDYHHEW
ncbi:MAG: DUF2148 domain-containing protein [Candidatus Thermoplasmatota archaeon]